MLEKATFFVLEASHINGIRVTIPAGNSYPYYQDKKEQVQNHQKKTPFQVLFLFYKLIP